MSPQDSLPEPLPCYILAGGQSSRFGSDKALVSIGGLPNLLRLKQQFEQLGNEVYVVADRADRYAELDIHAITDCRSGGGPLVGLLTSLRHCQSHSYSRWLLLLSCDQVIWRHEWYLQLVKAIHRQCAAIVFRDKSLQPIPGLYSTSIIELIERAVEAEQLSIRKLLSRFPERVLGLTTEFNPRQGSFNDSEQLQRLIDDCNLS